jgi:hypothetical protein
MSNLQPIYNSLPAACPVGKREQPAPVEHELFDGIALGLAGNIHRRPRGIALSEAFLPQQTVDEGVDRLGTVIHPAQSQKFSSVLVQ